jgi:SIR2-like domain
MAIEPADVLVFAGAGASMSPPSGLPGFLELRAAVLDAAGIDPPGDERRDLAPEPFLAALAASGVDVEGWLFEALSGGEPNAVHVAIARMVVRGAKVWTVNFDELIETAYQRDVGRPIDRVAWPRSPTLNAVMLKPHGTLYGEGLIVRSQQLVSRVSPAWSDILREHALGKVVVLIGYSGRDVDLAPILDEAFEGAKEVIWFDFDDAGEQERKRQLLARTSRAGLLELPHTSAPARSFIDWCISNSGIRLPADSLLVALETPRRIPRVPRPEITPLAPAMILDLLGDHRGARRTLIKYLLRAPSRRAANLLLSHILNHAGATTADAFAIVQLLPPLTSPLRTLRVRVRRKRVTAYHRCGRYRTVLFMTRRPRPTDTSSEVGVRAASLRGLGRIGDAIETGAEAIEVARDEGHPARLVHAVYQYTVALTVAGRAEEAEAILRRDLRGLAELTNSRWLAWSRYIAGNLALLRREPLAALDAFSAAEALFRLESLYDAVRSTLENRLIANRLAEDKEAFDETLSKLQTLRGDRSLRNGWRYIHRPRFGQGCVRFEEAELSRVVLRDQLTAARGYAQLQRSGNVLLGILGLLGQAALAVGAERGALARAAASRSSAIGADGLYQQARELAESAADPAPHIVFTA